MSHSLIFFGCPCGTGSHACQKQNGPRLRDLNLILLHYAFCKSSFSILHLHCFSPPRYFTAWRIWEFLDTSSYTNGHLSCLGYRFTGICCLDSVLPVCRLPFVAGRKGLDKIKSNQLHESTNDEMAFLILGSKCTSPPYVSLLQGTNMPSAKYQLHSINPLDFIKTSRL